MMTVDLNIAIAVFLSLSLLLVFIRWVVYNSSDQEINSLIQQTIVRCPYCAHLFRDDHDADMVRCPCCHSIVDCVDNRITS